MLIFNKTCFTSCSIFVNFEGGKRDISKYPFDNILITREYCCITFYRLTGILVTSLLNATMKA